MTFLFLYVFMSALTAENCFAAPAKTFKIDFYDSMSPWTNKDATGFANQIVKLAFKQVNIDVTYNLVSNDQCKKNVLSGKSIACLGLSADEDLQDKIAFSTTQVFGVHSDYYSNSKKTSVAKKEWQIKKGQTVGIVSGQEYPASVKNLGKEGVILEESPSEVVNLQRLALGQFDFAIVRHNSLTPSSDTVALAEVSDKVKFEFRGDLLKSYIGFSLKHPEGEWASLRFNKGFFKLKNSNKLTELEKSWTDLKASKNKNP